MDKTYICDGQACNPRPSMCYFCTNSLSACWHTKKDNHFLSNQTDFPPTKFIAMSNNSRTVVINDLQYEVVDEDQTLIDLDNGMRYFVPSELLAIDANLATMLKNSEDM